MVKRASPSPITSPTRASSAVSSAGSTSALRPCVQPAPRARRRGDDLAVEGVAGLRRAHLRQPRRRPCAPPAPWTRTPSPARRARAAGAGSRAAPSSCGPKGGCRLRLRSAPSSPCACSRTPCAMFAANDCVATSAATPSVMDGEEEEEPPAREAALAPGRAPAGGAGSRAAPLVAHDRAVRQADHAAGARRQVRVVGHQDERGARSPGSAPSSAR